MGWRHGFVASSFGKYIWSRTDRGWTSSAIIDAPEFWALAAKFANDDDLQLVGGKRSDGKPTLELMFANRHTQKLINKIYKSVCRYLSEQLDLKHPAIQALVEQEHLLKVEDRSWLTALDVFGIYCQDFSFSRLRYPEPGIVLTAANFERNALTSFEAGGSIAIADSDVVSVEGRGGEWLIRLSSDVGIELSASRGIKIGGLIEP